MPEQRSTVPMVKLQGIRKSFGTREAVRGVSCELFRGQIVGLLGPNGAGKSTTMKILAGCLKPTAGSISVGGLDLSTHSVLARRLIGYLPESNPLYDDMMVIDYLNFVADIRQIDRLKRKRCILNAIEQCGISTVLGQDIGSLSKGFRQRVGLAQAIMHEPDLLILDEPTSGLDPNQIGEILSLIQKFGKKKTVVVSSHILSEIQSTCSRVIIFSKGSVVADASPSRLHDGRGGAIYVELVTRDSTMPHEENILRCLYAIEGVVQIEQRVGLTPDAISYLVRYTERDPRRELFSVIVGLGLVLVEMRHQDVSLEESFRKLTFGGERESGPIYLQA